MTLRTHHWKYLLGAILAAPLLPLLYLQAKRIKASVPRLPEASGPSGAVTVSAGTDDFKVLFLGESTFAGVGVTTHDLGFPGAFSKELSHHLGRNVQWVVYARSGYTAEMVRQKLLLKIIETQADLIVIGLGGNDAFTLNRPWIWRKQIKNLIHDLKNKFPETPILFANMPPIKDFPAFTPLIKWAVGGLVEILGASLQQLVQQQSHVYYNQKIIVLKEWMERFEFRKKASDFFSDGVHPSELTYATWGKDLAAYADRNIFSKG